MTPERWERIAEIFHDALERAGPDRERFVTAACDGDAELRAEVAALLAGHADGPLDELEAAVPREIRVALPGEPAPGTHIGPYRLVDRIGRGGMGVVYLAERDEPDFEQRVALKLLRGGIDATELTGRFLTERRILARLEHPNITRLLDGGITRGGVPYFVMEHVDGEPIHRYCDRARLTVRERLALFLGVCEAMQYAHRHLVVHRDVKPSNILVTGDGGVKVLDFGIAKLLDDQEAAAAGQTRTGQRWMTPEYASPEQVRGEPVTTASDVYAMGVVLYELLTGRRPYDVEGRSRHEIERAILESEPSRPSTVVSRPSGADQPPPDQLGAARRTPPAKLRRQLAGDLDTIVLKALQKEPERRYTMAGELADDLRRHLDGLPVRARPDTLGYRVSRFVRRHRVGVAASGLIAIALGAGAVGTATQARRATLQARIATQERDRARTEAAKARQVTAFLVDLFDSADPGTTGGESLPVGELLERGAERAGEELADQPEVRAEMLDAIGRAYQNLGAYSEARPLLESALDVRRAAFGSAHPEVAEGLNDLAVLLHYAGDIDGAEANYREAISLRRRLLAEAAGAPDAPDADSLRGDLAGSIRSLAALLAQRRQFEESERLYGVALDLAESVYGPEHLETAMVMMGLSGPLKDRGELAAAESLLVRAVPMIRRHHHADHPDVYKAVNNLAAVYLQQGRHTEAEPLFRESLEMRRRLYGTEHPDVASAIQNLGAVLAELARADEAAGLYREALDMRLKLLGDDHPDVTYTRSALAQLYHDEGNCESALPLLEDALPGWKAAFGPRHGLTLKTQGLLGHCLARLQRYADAEQQLLESHAALDSLVGADHSETRRVAGFLAELYEAWGRPDRAAHYQALGLSSGS